MVNRLRIFIGMLLVIVVLTGCSITENSKSNTTEDGIVDTETNKSKNNDNQETNVTMAPENYRIQKHNLEAIGTENIDIDNFRLSRDNIYNNRMDLMDKIKNNSIVVLFSDYVLNDMKYNYTPNRNFYYFTGIDRENFILLMTKVDNEVNQYLFALDVQPVDKWTGKMLTVNESVYYSAITNILNLDLFESFFNSQLEHKNIDNVYVDIGGFEINQVIEKNNNVNSFLTPGEAFAVDVYNKIEGKEILSISQITKDMRVIKSDEEIDNIKKAIWITGEGIKEIMKNAKPGMMEYELEAYFDYRINSLGAKEHAFPTIAASGGNATIMHYPHNDQKVENGELVLFDLGASYGYYSSDISRTLPVNGTFTNRQKELYNIVLKAQLETMEAVRPGISLRELNLITREILASELIKIRLINSDNQIDQYYPHAVSHSLGLDTHDPSSFSDPLKAGMVITIEPGIYIEEEDIGIRIEDDILVTKDGYINLSEDIIKTIEEIEIFMKSN